MAFALAGSLIGFLVYNFSPARIFMGDTGSLLIGLFNSILVIKFINIAGAPDSKLPFEAAPAIGFSILIVPLFDTLRVFSLRISEKRSPFSPDRNHVHHFLLDLGFSHKMVTFSCVAANIGFIVLTYSLRSLGTTTAIGIMLTVAASVITIIYYKRSKVKLQAKSNLLAEEQLIKARKVLSFTPEMVEAE